MSAPDLGTLVKVIRDLVHRGRDLELALKDVKSAYGLTPSQVLQIRELV